MSTPWQRCNPVNDLLWGCMRLAKLLTMLPNSNKRWLSMSRENINRWKLFIYLVGKLRLIPAVGKWPAETTTTTTTTWFPKSTTRTPAPQVAYGCLQSTRKELIRLLYWAQYLNIKKLHWTSTSMNQQKFQNVGAEWESNIPAHVEECSGRTPLNLQCQLPPTANRR